MKQLLILLSLLSFISCSKDFSPVTTKYFNPQKLPLLKLENLDNFWHGNTIIHKSSISGIFSRTSGFLDGIYYSAFKKGSIAVTVFESQNEAIEAMEFRINNVAAIIHRGESQKEIHDIWWYTKGISPSIFINHNNTIIETYVINDTYEDMKDILTKTTIEISSRVEVLSD